MFTRPYSFWLPVLLVGGMGLGTMTARAQMPGETDSVSPPAASPDAMQNGPDQPPPAPEMNGGQSQDANGDAAAEGSAGVDFQTFYNSLSSEGTWIQTPQFGYVWQPNVNDPQWAPYTNGHWVYSDAGWTWVSNEPWGWATYHYGRWVNLDGTGWCWVPGYTWAPAWVSWRYGDGYVGWAPLPPDSLIGVDYDADEDAGFHIGGDCDSYYDIGAGWYCFLPVLYIGEGDYRHFYIDRYNNYRLINHTTNVTNLNIGARGGNVFAGATLGGPSVREVDASSQTPVAQVNLAFTNRIGGGAVNGNSLALFAPRVHAAGGRSAPQSFHALNTVAINRGTDPARPLTTTLRVQGVTPTTDQVRQAQAAQASAPVNAHVASQGIAAPLFQNQPLTAMRPASAPAEPTERRTYSAPSYSATPSAGNYRPASIYTNNSGARTYSPNYSGGNANSGANTHINYGGGGGGNSHAAGVAPATNPGQNRNH